MTDRATIRVIGIGNEWRGDDAVGLLAARRLSERVSPSVEVLEAQGDGFALLDLMEGAEHVVLIDAVQGGGHPGEILRFDISDEIPWETIVSRSTHALGLAEAIDLARALGRLPKHVVLYGITIHSVETGTTLSKSAEAGLTRAVQQVNEEVERARCMKCI